MSALICAILTFLIAMAAHLVVWRACRPRKGRVFILANIFFWTLIISVIALKEVSSYPDYVVLYCCLAAAYIVSYPAMEADSPSLAIIRGIAKAGVPGLDKDELYRAMTDEVLITARINDLLNDGLIRMDSGKYLLTSKGRFLAGVFIGFRRLLNAPKGG